MRYVYTREGSMPAQIPADMARGVALICPDPDHAERALDFAGLVMVRLGTEGATHLLRHWTAHEPALLRDFDPVLADVLAHTPELLTGPLRA
ncbi:MAG TPA: hypothetical protein VF746_31050 [Longimicrobium sp.]